MTTEVIQKGVNKLELDTEFCPKMDGGPDITNGFTAAFGVIFRRVMWLVLSQP